MSETLPALPAVALPSQQQDKLPTQVPAAYLKPADTSRALAKSGLKALPLEKKIMITRRCKVGTDIDSLVPSMAEEAKKRAGHDIYVRAVELNRGYAVLINDPTQMNVNVMFRFEAPPPVEEVKEMPSLYDQAQELEALIGVQQVALPNKNKGE